MLCDEAAVRLFPNRSRQRHEDGLPLGLEPALRPGEEHADIPRLAVREIQDPNRKPEAGKLHMLLPMFIDRLGTARQRVQLLRLGILQLLFLFVGQFDNRRGASVENGPA